MLTCRLRISEVSSRLERPGLQYAVVLRDYFNLKYNFRIYERFVLIRIYLGFVQRLLICYLSENKNII